VGITPTGTENPMTILLSPPSLVTELDTQRYILGGAGSESALPFSTASGSMDASRVATEDVGISAGVEVDNAIVRLFLGRDCFLSRRLIVSAWTHGVSKSEESTRRGENEPFHPRVSFPSCSFACEPFPPAVVQFLPHLVASSCVMVQWGGILGSTKIQDNPSKNEFEGRWYEERNSRKDTCEGSTTLARTA